MTYALSWPLQEGLFKLMCDDPACSQVFGHNIFDAAPPATAGAAVPDGVYVTFGDEEVADWSTASGNGAVHLITVSVFAPRRGFAEAKQAASAISDAVLSGAIALTRGKVVNVRFVDARTRRAESDTLRRIDMRYRITVEDS